MVAAAVGGPWLAEPGHGRRARSPPPGSSSSLLLTNSRLPFVLARAGQMPALARRGASARSGTPWVAVVLSSVCYSVFAVLDFKELIVLNIWLYSIALLLELAAFVALRLREPELPRPGASAAARWGCGWSRPAGRDEPARDGDGGLARTPWSASRPRSPARSPTGRGAIARAARVASKA